MSHDKNTCNTCDTPYGYSRGHRALEIAGILTFVGFAVANMAILRASLQSAGAWTMVLAGALVGYVAADFISGLVHWLADRYGTPQTPFAGPNFVGPFRQHHVDPRALPVTIGSRPTATTAWSASGSLWSPTSWQPLSQQAR